MKNIRSLNILYNGGGEIYPFPNQETLTDGASINHDVNSEVETWANLTTAQSTIAYTLSNFADTTFITLSILKTISGTCTITFGGTGLFFADQNAATKAAPSANRAIVLTGAANTMFEMSIKNTGMTYSANKVCTIATL